MTHTTTFPRILLGAPASGSGKTAVTCGLLCVLKRRGLEPVSFKCGPDYIDPMFHRTVFSIESRNLDMFFSGKEGVIRTLSKAAGRFGVIEGVMGLYDGTEPKTTEGSAYEIAQATDSPVLLIMPAFGAGRTIGSLILGLLSDDPDRRIRGIILNGMSSSYYEKICDALSEKIRNAGYDARLLGCIPKIKDLHLDSRHLGLKLPNEIDDLREQIERIADAIEENCDTNGILQIMRDASPLPAGKSKAGAQQEHPGDPMQPALTVPAIHTDRSPILAIARDDAFCFYYRENLDRLECAGIKLAPFSPIRDAHLPEGAAGLLLGGGYPELNLPALSENAPMKEAIRKAILSGMPAIAECGGFMYLHESIEDTEGKPYETAGVIEGTCRYTGHLVNFGYVTAAEHRGLHESAFADVLPGMRGHEFHYYESTAEAEDILLVKKTTGRMYPAMIARDRMLLGFPHFYYADSGFVSKLIEEMEKYGK